MRISTSGQYDAVVRDMTLAQEQMVKAQRQVSSGKRFSRVSEDWVAAAESLSLRTVKDAIGQYQTNIAEAKTDVSFAESAFSDMGDILKQAYTLSVQAANGTLDQSARESIATQIDQLKTRLVDFGNTRGPHNDYLFAGQKTDTKPFADTGSALTYSGDTATVDIEMAPGQTMAKTFVANQMFTDAYNALQNFKTNLQSGNTGAISGIDIQALQDSHKAFRTAQAQAGVRIGALEDIDSQHGRRLDDLSARISEVEDVDMSEAIVQFQLSQTAYQAALAAASKTFGLSLVDFIS
ncbi:MAG: flagellar hook-associated protein FlgL [Armatimonadetes bacterium]|nr:flagellar hook-associated protein FlgL [Armatimonadota bacterium]